MELTVEPLDKQGEMDQAYLESMINLIPPSFYFDNESMKLLTSNTHGAAGSDSEEEEEETEYKSGRMVHKSKKRKGTEEHKKPKHPRLGPTVTVSQLQKLYIEKEEQQRQDGGARRPKLSKKKKDLQSSTDTLEELRSKLESKIGEMKARRKWTGDPKSIAKKKERRELSKLKSKKKKRSVNGPNDNIRNGLEQKGKNTMTGGKFAKPVFNKEGKMVFSKFDFKENGRPQKHKEPSLGKKYQKLLNKVEKQKQKVAELKKTDATAAKTLEDKAAWKSALQRAEGVKVKDNPDLLKKAMKRKEKIKKKSKKEWDERHKKVDEKNKERSDKRKKNIQAKKQTRIDGKINKAKKKGRIIPGF